MGTPAFAVPPLKRLLESPQHQVVAVVTQPDRPAGRGRRLEAPPVKELALEHHLPVLQPEKIRNIQFDRVLAAYQPDVIVVVAYGRILPKEILELPRFGCLNLHASLLPKYRGAAPIQWAIINGERQTGVTLMKMDEGLDTGDIVAFETVEILEDDNTRSVSNMLSVIGAELLVRNLDRIEREGRVDGVKQDDRQATYAPLLKKSDGLIDWSLTCEQIICRINGLQPWPGAFSFLHGKAWRLLKAEPFEAPDSAAFGPMPEDEFEPGRVSATLKGRGFTVRTGDGHLLVTMVQPTGKKEMSATDALNGNLVKKGDWFLSDPSFLEGTPEVK